MKVKEVKAIKGSAGRDSYRKEIVKVLAENGKPMLLHELPGWIRDIKELENQGLISIGDTLPKMTILTEKGKSLVVYEAGEMQD